MCLLAKWKQMSADLDQCLLNLHTLFQPEKYKIDIHWQDVSSPNEVKNFFFKYLYF